MGALGQIQGIPKDSRRTGNILQDPKTPPHRFMPPPRGLWKTFDGGGIGM